MGARPPPPAEAILRQWDLRSNVHQAKEQFLELLERVAAGEEIVLELSGGASPIRMRTCGGLPTTRRWERLRATPWPIRAVSIWEITANGFVELPMTGRHAQTTGALPRHHDDPFDRMLIAQAKLEDLCFYLVIASSSPMTWRPAGAESRCTCPLWRAAI